MGLFSSRSIVDIRRDVGGKRSEMPLTSVPIDAEAAADWGSSTPSASPRSSPIGGLRLTRAAAVSEHVSDEVLTRPESMCLGKADPHASATRARVT
jgi:hypothetical protein